MQARTLPLSTLPSLVHAMSHRTVLLTNDYEASIAESDELRFEDWELQHSTAGVRSFMTAPLLFAGQVRSIAAIRRSGHQPASIESLWILPHSSPSFHSTSQELIDDRDERTSDL